MIICQDQLPVKCLLMGIRLLTICPARLALLPLDPIMLLARDHHEDLVNEKGRDTLDRGDSV